MPQTLAELKASSPAYAQMSDMEFASRIYRKHYADKMDFPTFAGKVGFDPYGDSSGSNPASAASDAENYAAGVGHSLYESARGVGQFLGDAYNSATDVLSTFAGQDPAADRRRAVDEQRRLDAPLLNTKAGMAGDISGTVGQVLVPGGVAKLGLMTPRLMAAAPRAEGLLGMVKSASLPATTRGAAAQGGILGLLQPVGANDSRLRNATLGTGAAAVGAGVPRIAGWLYRAGRNVAPVGAERKAAQVILAEAENPAALMQRQPSKIPGVNRTLAEETLDPGIARLERNARSTGRGWEILDRTNNAARVQAIEKFAGDEASIQAAKAARAQAANPLRKEALSLEGIDTNRLLSQIGRLEKLQQGRPAVQAGLSQIRSLLTRQIPDAERMKAAIQPLQDFIANDRLSANNREAAKQAIAQIKAGEWPTVSFGNGAAGTAGIGASYDAAKSALANARKALEKTTTGHDRVAVIDNVRKTIGDMLSGKYGGESAAALAGSRELMAVKSQLDRVLEKQAPQYGQYIDAFRKGSVPINRMEIGQSLMGSRSGSAILDPVTGRQVLTPAAFSRQARNLDAVAADATGFRKAKAADYLTPQNMATIAGVQDDLERRAFAATAGSGGNSQTFERMALNQRMAGGAAGRLPFVGRAMGYLNEMGQARLHAKLSEMLANPAEARVVLQRLSVPDRRIIETAVSRAGGSMGALLLPVLK